MFKILLGKIFPRRHHLPFTFPPIRGPTHTAVYKTNQEDWYRMHSGACGELELPESGMKRVITYIAEDN